MNREELHHLYQTLGKISMIELTSEDWKESQIWHHAGEAMSVVFEYLCNAMPMVGGAR